MRLCSAACAARANSPYQSMRPWVQVKWTNSHGGLTRTGGLRQQMLRCCMRVKVLMMTHVPPLSEEGLCRLLECSEALVCLALLPPPTSSPGEPSPHVPLPTVCLRARRVFGCMAVYGVSPVACGCRGASFRRASVPRIVFMEGPTLDDNGVEEELFIQAVKIRR